MAGVGSIGAVTVLGYIMLFGLTVPIRMFADDPMVLMNISPPRPQAKILTPPEPQKKAKPLKGRASAANLKAKASPIVAPIVMPLVPSPVTAAAVANIGAGASNGASDRPGPGQGAGGVGDGLGGGGDGDGGDTPPRQIKGRLSFSDMPSVLRVTGIERVVAVRYTVNVDGRVTDCTVTESSGSAELDGTTCRLIEKRFRYKPSRDGSGRAVPSIVEEEHSWRLDPGSSGSGSAGQQN